MGLDVEISRIRHLRRYRACGLVGLALALPFRDGSLDCPVCSGVIEHLPAGPRLFTEIARLLQPGGRLIIGTPDCGGPLGPLIQFLYACVVPAGHAGEHVTHDSRRSLEELLGQYGFECQAAARVGGAELILRCVKK